MSAVCPACGVAVVSGYVKCPKCRAALPYSSGRRGRATHNPGGTAVKEGESSVAAFAIPVVIAIAAVVFLATRDGDEPSPDPAIVNQPAQPNPSGLVQVPVAQPAPVETPLGQPAADPSAAVGELERTLQRQRMFAAIEITGTRIDLRSSSCGEPAMTSTIAAAGASLRGVGLTRLRCLAQSGTVVLERDL